MAVTSDSTYAELLAQFRDNADYDLNDSVDQAKLFIDAGRQLLMTVGQSARAPDGSVVTFDMKNQWQYLIDQALRWVRGQADFDTGDSRPTYADLSEART